MRVGVDNSNASFVDVNWPISLAAARHDREVPRRAEKNKSTESRLRSRLPTTMTVRNAARTSEDNALAQRVPDEVPTALPNNNHGVAVLVPAPAVALAARVTSMSDPLARDRAAPATALPPMRPLWLASATDPGDALRKGPPAARHVVVEAATNITTKAPSTTSGSGSPPPRESNAPSRMANPKTATKTTIHTSVEVS